MLKRLILIILIALASLTIFAQQEARTVKGVVIEEDGTPVMYASVSLIQNGKVTSGVLTDTTGIFILKGQFKGSVKLKVSSVGYEDVLKELQLSDRKTHDVGQIVLSEKTMQLEGVVVTGRAADKSVTLERTRVNVASSMSAATGSVLDALKGSAAVTVDGNGQVAIRGNSNVLILVDGIPTTLDGLGAIPAANVQSIDIVTSPDVKYDSEGTGGIINVISKKQAPEAFTAMASVNYGVTHFLNGNLAMSYNVGCWGIRMNYNGKLEKDRIESELHRQILKTASSLDQIVDASKKTTGHNLGLNVSYKATKRDVMTLDMKVGFPRMNNYQTMHNHYVTDGIPSEKLRQTDIAFNREMVEGSLGYKRLFDPGRREFSVLVSLSAINGHRPSYYYEDGQMVQRSKSGGHPRIPALQLDYMTPWGHGKLETGVKLTYRHNNIDHKMYEFDAATESWQLSIPLSNDLRHRELIPAAYAMYTSKLNEKLSMKAGLRLEYSHVTLKGEKDKLDESNNCFFVAPNLVLNYRVSKPWELSFSLSRRISRPTYPQLNPYINLIDNETYEIGNVRLKPEQVSKFDFGYTYTGQTLKVSGNAYLSYTNDYINQIAYLDQNILVMTYINGDMDLKTGIEHNIRWNAQRWIGIDLGSNIFFTRSCADWNGTEIRNNGWTSNSSATLNLTPLQGMTIQAQYFVTTPQYFPQFTTKTVHYCNLGLRQQLRKYSLTISALLTDVFNTRRWDISSDNPVYTLINTSCNRSRVFWLGLSWNFHSFKPVGGQKKQEEDRSLIRLGE